MLRNPPYAKTKKDDFWNHPFSQTGNDLLSQAASHQVSSALESLTAVFEMGTGVPSPLLSPDLSLENYSSLHVLFLQKPLVKLSTY